MEKMKVAFTFDDGLIDHIEYAAPILEKYGYHGIFCVVPDFVGKPGYMTWNDIRELVSRGHDIASHTISHKNLLSLYVSKDISEIRRQIIDSKKTIENEIGKEVKYLAFPHNAHNAHLFEIVRECEQIPLTPHRINLGGYPADDVAELGLRLQNLAIRREKYAVLMFHGIVKGSAYASYDDPSGDAFEQRVMDVKHYDGMRYNVVNYSAVNWPIFDVHSLKHRIYRKIKGIVQQIFY